jgi:hypothetical protein
MSETINDIRESVVAGIAADLAQESAPEVATIEEEKKILEGVEPDSAEPEAVEAEADAEESGEEVTDEEVAEEPEVPAVDPPHFWSKDEKEKFASLPPEMQELVKAKFDDNERYVNQQKMEVAEAKKSAAKEAEQLSAIRQRVEAAAKAAESQFGDRWGKFTPAVWADLAQNDTSEYYRLKALYDADQLTTREATAAREATERLEREQWVASQAERLKTLVPELVGPEGKKLGGELADYIKSMGAGDDDLANLSAEGWAIAHKAMLYDKAKSAKPITKKAAPTGLPSKAPPPPRATVQQQQRKALETRINTGTGSERRAALAQSLIDDGFV